MSQRSNTLALGATSAALSYALATTLFGSEDAVFAPIAAVVSTGLSAGHRLRRAIEICFGVLLGLVAADLLSRWIGIGAWQLGVAVLLARLVAVALSSSVLLSNQAAVAAVVVMALGPLTAASPWFRLGDGIVGGVTAVALTAVFAPDPFRGLSVVTERVLKHFGDELKRLEKALREDSLEGTQLALSRLEDMTDARQELRDAASATRERIRLGRSATREAQRAKLRVAELIAGRIELLISSGMGLCRAGASLVRHEGRVSPLVPQALGELAEAIDALRGWAKGEIETKAVQERALKAAVTASSASRYGASTALSLMVGQVRTTVVDVLWILGREHEEAVATLEAAAGRADQLGRTPIAEAPEA